MVWAPLPRADSGDALPPAGFVLGLGSLPGAWVECAPSIAQRRYFNYVCMYVGCGAGAVLLEQRTPVRQRALSEQGAHFPALRIR